MLSFTEMWTEEALGGFLRVFVVVPFVESVICVSVKSAGLLPSKSTKTSLLQVTTSPTPVHQNLSLQVQQDPSPCTTQTPGPPGPLPCRSNSTSLLQIQQGLSPAGRTGPFSAVPDGPLWVAFLSKVPSDRLPAAASLRTRRSPRGGKSSPGSEKPISPRGARRGG